MVDSDVSKVSGARKNSGPLAWGVAQETGPESEGDTFQLSLDAFGLWICVV